jgi:Family of unknown function (DUF6962)
MLIGKDYDKIEFNAFGLDLVEPNAFYGDTIICTIALIIAFKIKKHFPKTPFFVNWRRFFIIFGVGFFMGGIGHTFFNYLGVPGKYPAWYVGIFAAFFIERAMISLYPVEEKRVLFSKISSAKLILALCAATLVFVFVNLEKDPSIGLRVPSINTSIGLFFALGILGYRYAKKINPGFKYLWISVIVLVPTAIIQSLKFGLHQWFDRNDISHIFLIVGMILYYTAIKKYGKSLSLNA